MKTLIADDEPAMKTRSLLNRKVQLAFGSAIAILLVVSAFSYRAMVVSSESDRWVRHTHEVLEQLQDLLFAMEGIQSSIRGFVLTGNESYLDSYRTSRSRVERDQATVRDLTLDNPEQQRKLPALASVAAGKIQHSETLISLYRAKGLEAAADDIRSGSGQRTMVEFKTVVQQLQDEELRLLALREADAKRNLSQTKTVLILGTSLGLLITAAAAWSVQRVSSRRGLAEEALRNSEEKYRTFVDGVQDYAIFMLDPGGRVVSWNAGAERIKGYTAGEIIGHNFSRFFPPEDIKQGRPEEVLRMTVASGRHEERGMRVRKDGSRFLASVIFTALRDPSGNLRGFSEISRDLSESTESEAKYRGLLEAAPDAIVVVNQGGEIVLLNVQAEKQFGYRRDELVGQQVKNIIPEGFAERLLADGLRSVEDALAQQIGTGIELTGRRKDGSEFPIEIMLSPLESIEGTLVTAAIRDISVRKQAEDRIVHLNRVYAMLSGINTLIVRVRERGELFREACRIAVEGGGFRMSLIGIVDSSTKKIVPVASAGKDEGLLTAIKGILSSSEGAPSTMVAQAIREKKAVVSNNSRTDSRVLFGKQYAESGVCSMAIMPLIVAEEAVGVLALYAGQVEFFHEEELKLLKDLAGDIAFAIDHIDKQERLNYLAYYDVLTGLANRALFNERLEQRLMTANEQGRKLGLVLLDIERFKTINDTLGRQAGDALLKKVAERLSGYAGDVGRLARIDADHFAVMVSELRTEEELAHLIEQRIVEVFGPPFRIGDSELRVSAKFGIAMFPADGVDADTLFKNAEAALKNAKARGDRYLFYTQTMNGRVAEKLTLENQLRQALDNGEFVLHYQPKINLVSGKLTSAEALIRWNDPRTGLVPPGRFIPILEETGLINEVGRWALHQAIADYLRWRAAGLLVVRIAVNVSPLQLRHRGFIDEIRQAIGIDPHAAAGLELEITESLIMADVKHNIASLRAIRAMGVTIAIDDFGTGFSSLSYLAKLPVDTLKIDRSFVVDMTTGPEGLALVSTIINLAHSLKLNVVAEGVETEEQSRLLRILGCDEMQGFLFSKPVPSEIFETRYLAQSSGR
jgi:diguanylate cyclase (GGDEF)-like protein/PAS domain S-box-containing protein